MRHSSVDARSYPKLSLLLATEDERQKARPLRLSLDRGTEYALLKSMLAAHTIDTSTRLAVLNSSLSQLRREADRVGAGDAIHRLRNSILTAQGALGLIESRVAQGRSDEVDKLLELAENRIREARSAVARRQCSRRTMIFL